MPRTAVIKKRAARYVSSPVLLGEGAEPAAAPGPASREPIVSVRRHGELVEALEVTCPCGNHMVIECLYDARKTEAAP